MRRGIAPLSDGGAARFKAILLDLDGVVYVGRSVIAGSLEAMSRIWAAQIPLEFITNTARRSRRRVARDLAADNLQVAVDLLLS